MKVFRVVPVAVFYLRSIFISPFAVDVGQACHNQDTKMQHNKHFYKVVLQHLNTYSLTNVDSAFPRQVLVKIVLLSVFAFIRIKTLVRNCTLEGKLAAPGKFGCFSGFFYSWGSAAT